MDHSRLNIEAMGASAERARAMGLRAGDEICVPGVHAYRITDVDEHRVLAVQTVEHGHFVTASKPVALDLRGGGWTRIMKE